MRKSWIAKGKRKYQHFKDLRGISSLSKELIKRDNENGAYHLMVSMVFSAFTLEAFLNHVGAIQFKKNWPELERLRTKEKLIVLSEKLNLQLDFGKRPWQTYNEINNFRNLVVHAKPEIIDFEITVQLGSSEIYLPDSKIEKYLTEEWCDRFFTDTEEICITLAKEAGIPTKHLFFSLPLGSSISIDEITVNEEDSSQSNLLQNNQQEES